MTSELSKHRRPRRGTAITDDEIAHINIKGLNKAIHSSLPPTHNRLCRKDVDKVVIAAPPKHPRRPRRGTAITDDDMYLNTAIRSRRKSNDSTTAPVKRRGRRFTAVSDEQRTRRSMSPHVQAAAEACASRTDSRWNRVQKAFKAVGQAARFPIVNSNGPVNS